MTASSHSIPPRAAWPRVRRRKGRDCDGPPWIFLDSGFDVALDSGELVLRNRCRLRQAVARGSHCADHLITPSRNPSLRETGNHLRQLRDSIAQGGKKVPPG